MSDHANTIRIFAHHYGAAEAAVGAIRALDALLAENQRNAEEIERLRDRAVCSGCGSDVGESGICPYQGCDDGEMIPASDLPGALREACDAQTEQWQEHVEEIKEMQAENQRLRDALERIAFAKGKPTPDPLWCIEVARAALAAVREENE